MECNPFEDNDRHPIAGTLFSMFLPPEPYYHCTSDEFSHNKRRRDKSCSSTERNSSSNRKNRNSNSNKKNSSHSSIRKAHVKKKRDTKTKQERSKREKKKRKERRRRRRRHRYYTSDWDLSCVTDYHWPTSTSESTKPSSSNSKEHPVPVDDWVESQLQQLKLGSKPKSNV